MSDFDSLILDECQEAKGASPMVEICSHIDSYEADKRPRVLGISSGFKSSAKISLNETIKSLERIMNSKVVHESTSQSIKDSHFYRIVQYHPRSIAMSLDDYIKRPPSLFPYANDTLEIQRHMRLVLNHAYLRAIDSFDLFSIYQLLRQEDSQPIDYAILDNLYIPSIPYSQHRNRSNARNSHHDLRRKCYDQFEVEDRAKIKSLVFDLALLLITMDTCGVIVALHSYSIILNKYLNHERRPVQDRSIGHSIVRNKLSRYSSNLKYSIFSITRLIEFESMICDSLVEIFICLCVLVGSDVCAKASECVDSSSYNDDIVKILDFVSTDIKLVDISTVIAGFDRVSSRFGISISRLNKLSLVDTVRAVRCGCDSIIDAIESFELINLLQSYQRKQLSFLSLDRLYSSGSNLIAGNSTSSDSLNSHQLESHMKKYSYEPISDKVHVLCELLTFTNESSNTNIPSKRKLEILDIAENVDSVVYCNDDLVALSIRRFLNHLYNDLSSKRFKQLSGNAIDLRNRKETTIINNKIVYVEYDSPENSNKKMYNQIIHFDIPSNNEKYYYRNKQLVMTLDESGQEVNKGGIVVMLSHSIGKKDYDIYNRETVHRLLSYHYNRSELEDYFESIDKYNDSDLEEGECKPEILDRSITSPISGQIVNSTQSKNYLFKLCELLSYQSKYTMNPTYFIETIEHHNRNSRKRITDTSFRCSILLPPSVPGSYRCFVGKLHKNKLQAETLTALECIEKLLATDTIVQALKENENKKLINKTSVDQVVISSNTNPVKLTDIYNDRRESISKTITDDNIEFFVKTVPDSLVATPVIGEVVLYIYRTKSRYCSDLDRATIEGCRMCSRQSQAIEEVSFAFLSPISSEISCNDANSNDLSNNLVIETAMAGRESLDLQIQYVDKLIVTDKELFLLQRYHRAVLAWESERLVDDLKRWVSCEEYSQLFNEFISNAENIKPTDNETWTRSSNGSWYLLIPRPNVLQERGRDEWSREIVIAGNEAQSLIHNLLVQDYLKLNDVIPEYSTSHCDPCTCCIDSNCNGVDRYVSYLVSRGRERLAVVIGDDPSNEAKRVTVDKEDQNDTSDTKPDDVNVEDDEAIANEHMWKVMPLGSLATIIPLLEKKSNSKAPHSSHHEKIYTSSRASCIILGHSKYFFLGLIAPSIIWRITSLLLAEEARSYLTSLFDKSFSYEISKCNNLSVDVLFNKNKSEDTLSIPSNNTILESITPRRCNEHINFERLEFIGDTFLKFITSLELYKLYPTKREGFLTDARKDLVSNTHLIHVSSELGIIKYMRAIPLSAGRMGLLFRPPGSTEFSVNEGFSLWNEHIITLQIFRGPKKSQINDKKDESSDDKASSVDINMETNELSGKDITSKAVISNESVKVVLKENSEEVVPDTPKVIERLHIDSSYASLYPRPLYMLATKIKEKTPADLIEAIIGAFLVGGGIESASTVVKAFHCWPRVEVVERNLDDTMHTLDESLLLKSVVDPPVIPNDFPEYLRLLAVSATDSFSSNRSTEERTSSSYGSNINTINKAVEFVYKKFNYRFNNYNLLEEAFTYNTLPNQINNQRMEYLGDAILDFAIVVLLCKDFSLTEGELSMMKNNMLNNESLAIKSLELGLYKYIIVPAEINQSIYKEINGLEAKIASTKLTILNTKHSNDLVVGEINRKVFNEVLKMKSELIKPVADMFESLIAAIYLDSSECME
eukprot:CAMPEP_0196763732 /NCGR_PEP_ID=MMETSP1095-20130614/4626_1 /TAXON_ID=96789 ORGANISM="Chromulina nebulosa, Strain UTEXLB2642" /NCGR_SAMPLE_ID=MMETSP1095 /ASSEMBLY_ACC=CAM_ASM_000446 /LENGTH=1704 /DNA_ID=CAMNT_0042117539 /DNA_START=96 /DNA_END=5207 /DNA_ORIENTATION=+